MNPRVLEILDRRAAIRLAIGELCAEDLVLETELREILEGRAEENDDVDFSMFKETTARLLTEFWNAPNKMLSQEDIRQDVILDEEASDKAVKNVIARARYELAEANAKFDIKNVFGKGYQLVPRIASKAPKRRKSLKRKE